MKQLRESKMNKDQKTISFWINGEPKWMDTYFPEQLVKAYKAIGIEAVVTPF